MCIRDRYQGPESRYRRLTVDGSYIEAECSGWDDMFPTIDQMCIRDRLKTMDARTGSTVKTKKRIIKGSRNK